MPPALRTLDCVDIVVLVHLFVFILLEVEELDVTSVIDCCEDERREWTPSHIHNRSIKCEVHHWVRFVNVPQFHGEVSRAGDEGVRVVLVPVHVLHRQGVPALGLQLSTCLRFTALVDSTFLGADEEFSVVVLRAEVEAGGCRLPRDG